MLCHSVLVSSNLPGTGSVPPRTFTDTRVPSRTFTVMPLGLAWRLPFLGVMVTLAADFVGLGLGVGLGSPAWPPEPEEVEQPLATIASTARTTTLATTQRQRRAAAHTPCRPPLVS